MVDRVHPLKFEAPESGGIETDQYPTGLDKNEDYVDCRGVTFQDDVSNDVTVYITRDSSGNLVFQDIYGPCTLTAMVTGTISNLNLCLETDPPTPSNDYSNTYLLNKVTQEIWRRQSDNSVLKTIDYSYSGNLVSQEVRKVYADDGVTILGQLTIVYNYTGSKITSINTTRDV